MPELVDVAVADLLLDSRNARLKSEQTSEQEALLSIARQQGKRLLSLAADIVEHGLDPISLPAIVPTADQRKRYIVVEGNRRIVALKAMETPSLVAPVFNSADRTRLNNLAKRFSQQPIGYVRCVLFESEKELEHWVTLRHTGQNEGVGLVEWGADEKDRYASRHGTRSTAGRILDFVDEHGQLSAAAQDSNKGIITSLRRLVNTPEVREALGIDTSGDQIARLYPVPEVAKGLTRVVEDLKTERAKVGDIYHLNDRRNYIRSFSTDELPDPATRLDSPKSLNDTDETDEAASVNGESATNVKNDEVKPKRRKSRKAQSVRTALIPNNCRLNIDPPRINAIYSELLTLSVDQYPNASSVALRVFVELSIDHYVGQHALLGDKERRETPLAKRLKKVAEDLRSKGAISEQLETAVQRIADSKFVLSASTATFNQYVHNQYVFPKATELKDAWDELQPFLEKVWA